MLPRRYPNLDIIDPAFPSGNETRAKKPWSRDRRRKLAVLHCIMLALRSMSLNPGAGYGGLQIINANLDTDVKTTGISGPDVDIQYIVSNWQLNLLSKSSAEWRKSTRGNDKDSKHAWYIFSASLSAQSQSSAGKSGDGGHAMPKTGEESQEVQMWILKRCTASRSCGSGSSDMIRQWAHAGML